MFSIQASDWYALARVNIGQSILSIRCKESNAAVTQEALRHAWYKFLARQNIIVSKKRGFTNMDREDYLKPKEEKRVLQDRAGARCSRIGTAQSLDMRR